MTDTPVVTIENVSYRYNGSNAVENVSISVHAGDYLGIMGPNGSGKTTLLKLMLGLITPQTGRISLFGKPIREFRDWTRIGYIPQKATQFDLHFPITVGEIVALGRTAKKGLFGRFNRKDRQVIAEAMEKAGISKLKANLVTELSGGQQQRVFIAKALASEPELLVLDEPTVGVDVESQEKFYELLTRLNQEGKSIVLVSHDLDVVANEVKTLACINKHLIYHGTPKDFITQDYLEKLYGKSRRLIIHGH